MPAGSGAGLASRLARMKSGESRHVTTTLGHADVHYDAQQSLGDDNRPVHGATVGTYEVHLSSGQIHRFDHGPFASTESAARRGASRDSKTLVAGHAADVVNRHLSNLQIDKLFNDRRGGG